LTRQREPIYIGVEVANYRRGADMPVHLTPSEIADELDMKRRDVLKKAVEMNVPVLRGKIDKTLFESSLRAMQRRDKSATA
jgi:hypothetical protein